MSRYVVGVDIGGTTIKLGLFEETGSLKKKWEIPTELANDGENILPEIAAEISAKMAEMDLSAEQLLGMGLGVPGPADAAGIVHGCNNLGWGTIDVRAAMEQYFPGSVIAVGNDANTAALGELWQGSAAGYRSAVLLTLGTGVGGGVVLNGRLLAGAHGSAGELGHITVEPEETVPCTCGKCGCLEQYASARGAARLARRMLQESDAPSALRDLENFTAKELCDLAREGEPFAQSVLGRVGDYLGRAMSYVSCVVDPEVFIVGGGMSRAGETLTEPMMRAYRKYAFHTAAQTPCVLAKLGNDAGIYGAARMVLTAENGAAIR